MHHSEPRIQPHPDHQPGRSASVPPPERSNRTSGPAVVAFTDRTVRHSDACTCRIASRVAIPDRPRRLGQAATAAAGGDRRAVGARAGNQDGRPSDPRPWSNPAADEEPSTRAFGWNRGADAKSSRGTTAVSRPPQRVRTMKTSVTQPRASAPAGNSHRVRVLVADGDGLARRMMSDTLRQADRLVVIAAARDKKETV